MDLFTTLAQDHELADLGLCQPGKSPNRPGRSSGWVITPATSENRPKFGSDVEFGVTAHKLDSVPAGQRGGVAKARYLGNVDAEADRNESIMAMVSSWGLGWRMVHPIVLSKRRVPEAP